MNPLQSHHFSQAFELISSELLQPSSALDLIHWSASLPLSPANEKPPRPFSVRLALIPTTWIPTIPLPRSACLLMHITCMTAQLNLGKFFFFFLLMRGEIDLAPIGVVQTATYTLAFSPNVRSHTMTTASSTNTCRATSSLLSPPRPHLHQPTATAPASPHTPRAPHRLSSTPLASTQRLNPSALYLPHMTFPSVPTPRVPSRHSPTPLPSTQRLNPSAFQLPHMTFPPTPS